MSTCLVLSYLMLSSANLAHGSFTIGNNLYDHVWHSRRSMPQNRSDMTATTVDDAIYLVGGCALDQAWCGVGVTGWPGYSCGGSSANGISASTYRYIPKSNTFETLADAPRPRYRHAAAAVNKKIYLFGGVDGLDKIIPQVDGLDTATGQWATLAQNMTDETTDLGTLVHSGKVYIAGGYDATYTASKVVQVKELGSKSTKKLEAAINEGDRAQLSRKKMNKAKQKLHLLQRRYTGYESLLEAVQDGTGLVKGSYIAGQCRRLKRCQDVPPASFWSSQQYRAMMRSIELVALSYCWIHPVHPDPKSEHLNIISRAIKLRLALKGSGRVQDLAIFFDYCSLPQNGELGPENDPEPGAERTPEEKATFKKGLTNVNLWYCHQLTCVWLLKWVPERVPNKYQDRGWPFFEQAISWMITDSTNLVDLDDTESDDWTSLHERCRSQRGAPILPDVFAGLLQQKAFTNGEEDMAFVAEKYRETFEEAVGHAESLHFGDLHWGDEEAISIAAALPFCTRLEQLAFQNNNITSSGAAEVVKAACACFSLQGLDFTGNLIETANQRSMAQEWQAAGKLAHWLSFSSHD